MSSLHEFPDRYLDQAVQRMVTYNAALEKVSELRDLNTQLSETTAFNAASLRAQHFVRNEQGRVDIKATLQAAPEELAISVLRQRLLERATSSIDQDIREDGTQMTMLGLACIARIKALADGVTYRRNIIYGKTMLSQPTGFRHTLNPGDELKGVLIGFNPGVKFGGRMALRRFGTTLDVAGLVDENAQTRVQVRAFYPI